MLMWGPLGLADCGDIRQMSRLMQSDASWTNDVEAAAVD